VIHSEEFDDVCINHSQEDDRMANEDQRYVFLTVSVLSH